MCVCVCPRSNPLKAAASSSHPPSSLPFLHPPSFPYLDVVSRRIVQQVLSSLELLNELLLPPRGQRLNGGIQSKGTQFEADLVIPLAGGTVRQPFGALFLRDLDLALGDDGAGQGGAKEVAAFVLGVGLLEKGEGGRGGGREGEIKIFQL